MRGGILLLLLTIIFGRCCDICEDGRLLSVMMVRCFSRYAPSFVKDGFTMTSLASLIACADGDVISICRADNSTDSDRARMVDEMVGAS